MRIMISKDGVKTEKDLIMEATNIQEFEDLTIQTNQKTLVKYNTTKKFSHLLGRPFPLLQFLMKSICSKEHGLHRIVVRG